MLSYAAELIVQGSVSRQRVELEDKAWQRWKTLDSLLGALALNRPDLPRNLLFASTDGQRPSLSALFESASYLGGLNDLWNALLKQPSTSSCFVQIVDQAPGTDNGERMALEKSLMRVTPYPLDALEELLEVQGHVYETRIFSGVFLDRHGRLGARTEQDFFSQGERGAKASTFVEAVLRQGESEGLSKKIKGRDFKVQDFKLGLQGVPELFAAWDRQLSASGRSMGQFERIYVYSQLKGLLPGVWGELKTRGVAADQVRLPQWIAHSNTIASYLEFLMAEVKSAAFVFVSMNGNCHIAEWNR